MYAIRSYYDRAESGEVLQAVHEAGERCHGIRVVVQQATAPGTQVQKEAFGEVRERVVRAHRVQDPQDP